MRIFASSDLHFNHENIRKPEYCNRPFNSLEEMNNSIVNRWNETVSPEDRVFFLGDLAMGQKIYHLDWLNSLNGEIMFIPGNHDRYLVKMDKQYGLHDLGVKNATMLPPLHNEMIDGRLFVMSHFPLEEWEGMPGHHSDGIGNSVMIHGHCHGSKGAKSAVNRYDIGIDNYGRPVELTADLRFLEDPKGW